MRVSRRSGTDTQTILTGLITDPIVANAIAEYWNGGLFTQSWANLIGGWAVRHYQKFGEEIGSTIEEVYANYSEDNEDTRHIESFLQRLSDDRDRKKRLSTDYILSVAEKHFNEVRLLNLATEIQNLLESRHVKKAMELRDEFYPVSLQDVQDDDVISKEGLLSAQEDDPEPIIKYPKDLGKFFGDCFHKGAFFSFLGPDKSGKSFWLLDVAFRAALNRQRVAYFEAGDMNERQVRRRLMSRVCRKPLKPTICKVPKGIEEIDNEWEVTHEEREFTSIATAKETAKRFRKLVRSRDTLFRLRSYGTGSLTVGHIQSHLASWKKRGWQADVLVIDYADILAMPNLRESRDAINATWKQLRRIALDEDLLVVTATQADARSYGRNTLSMANFSEDKRKNSHVTGMVGINQTLVEQQQGLTRLNWIVRREADKAPQIKVAGCLSIANPALISTF